MWIHESADVHLDAVQSEFGPLLLQAMETLRARHRRPDHVTSGTGELVRPLTELPNWVADAVRRLGPEVDSGVLADLIGASVVGYFHVRVQDDFFDEGLGSAHEVMMLGEALLTRAQSLIGRHVGSSGGFWSLHDEVMRGYAESMLLERGLAEGAIPADDDVFTSLVRRSGPLILPAAAVLAHADQLHLLPELQRFVDHTSRAVQLANDLRDVNDDLSAGRPNWVAHLLADGGEPDNIGRRLTVGGGFDQIVDIVSGEFEQALVAAQSLGSHTAAEWCVTASTVVSSWPEKFFTVVFGEPPIN